MSLLQSLPQIIAAVGGLGTAAFGLVDSTKPTKFESVVGYVSIGVGSESMLKKVES